MKNIGVEVSPEHAYGRAFLEGVAEYATKKGDWRLCSLSQDRLTPTVMNSLDGIIIRVLTDESERKLKKLGSPVVDIYGAKARRGVAQIHGDYTAFAKKAADFFVGRGFTHFGWCGVKGLVFSDQLGQAFERFIRESGHDISMYQFDRPRVEVFAFDRPDYVPDAKSIRRWLLALPKPAAIYCCNDHRAYQVMRVALEAKIKIPNEIVLLGNDNDSTICSFAQVPISSIDSNAVRIGYSAARLLDAVISQKMDEKFHRAVMVPPGELVERPSTEHIPIYPAWLSPVLLKIERDACNGLTAGDVVRIAGLSAPSVERVFREKFGISVVAYLTSVRMKRAERLLRTTDLLIKEVAAACGYATPQYFCRAFRSFYGRTPKRVFEKR